MKSPSKIRVIELFAGVGGFRLGLEGYKGDSATSNYGTKLSNKIPFEIIYSNQWEPATKRQHANEVYLNRFGPKGHFDKPIEKLVESDLSETLPIECDLMVGGFPCQDYSVASTLRNSKGLIGPKGVLWWQIEGLLDKLKTRSPNYLIFENVDRLLKSPAKQRGRDFAVMLRSLDNLGYNVEWRVINAGEYGFPQRRRRIFIFGFKKSSPLSKNLKQYNKDDIVQSKGVIGKAFPSEILISEKISLPKNLNKISEEFNGNFLNAGVMINNDIETFKVSPKYNGPYIKLSNILQEKDIDSEFYISKKDEAKWKEHKGAKKITRVTKEGYEYKFSEGGMCYPDDLDKPSRTIITSEGGATPSRFKHVVVCKINKKKRRLTPIELEKLNMFPDDFTKLNDITNSKRAFFMGNALVIGIVEKLGNSLSSYISKL